MGMTTIKGPDLPPEPTPAERHAEVVALLREIRAEAGKPPLIRLHNASDQPASFGLNIPLPAGTTPPAEDMINLQNIPAGTTLALPEGMQVEYAYPLPPVIDRLLTLLSLSDAERAFVRAAADARHDPAEQYDALLVFADWLEDQGREAVGARVRRLVPESGDVLVMTYRRSQNLASHLAREEDEAQRNNLLDVGKAIADDLDKLGRQVYTVVLPEGFDLRTAMDHGLIRVEDYNDSWKSLRPLLDGEPEGKAEIGQIGLIDRQAAALIARLKAENAALRERVAALEGQNARLMPVARHSQITNDIYRVEMDRLKEAVAAEREACATLAMNRGDRHGVGAAIAEAIRDRDTGEAT
jgi:hypothetical protein